MLLVAVTFVSVIARWIPLPEPIVQALAGGALAFLPPFRGIQLDPELFFVAFLPPLLFADGWQMPIREMLRAKRPILLLSLGLVAFTTALVAVVARLLAPEMPWAMAFALGAVVSPTDAVAVSAITAKLKVPYRLSAVLNGESLLNDATGLVAFRFALAAVAAGTVSMAEVASSFLLLSVGGVALGLALGYGVGKLRDGLRRIEAADARIETTLSLMTPFGAYLMAEYLSVSTVLAVVAAGLYSGWRDPVKMDVETRQMAWSVWAIYLYWLNAAAFLLLGLTAPQVYLAAREAFEAWELAAMLGTISATVILARIAWMFPGAYLPGLLVPRIRGLEARPPVGSVFVTAWAGMRGTVTLAAALSIPLALPSGSPMPSRDVVVFLALGVVAVTLLAQGVTLGPIIRRLGIQEDSSHAREEKLARVSAVRAGLEALREAAARCSNRDSSAAVAEVIAEYEHRLAELDAEGDTRAEARTRLRVARTFRSLALAAERRQLDELWRGQAINDEVYRPLQALLDHEEARLTGDSRRDRDQP